MPLKYEKNKKNILVVDDEEGARELISSILLAAGYNVTVANGGAEALAILQNKTFDLIITDIKMPYMGGIELLQKIRATGSKVDVICMTAYGEVETYLKALSLGAAEYLNKPIRIKELTRIVNKVLEEAVDRELNSIKKQNEYLLETINYLENKLDKYKANSQSELVIDKYRAIVGATGHSLKTELMNIGGSIMLLRELAGHSPECAEQYDLIERSVQFSQLLLRKLLDFLDMGKANIEQIDIAELIQKTVALVKPRLSSNIQLKETVLHDAGGYTTSANYEQLMEVLVELVQNASTALRTKGGTIELRLEKRGNEIALSVRDNGLGIAAELRNELFVKEVKSKHGLGLGLHLSSKIINALGGKLTVENTSKKGTTITILMPAVVDNKE